MIATPSEHSADAVDTEPLTLRLGHPVRNFLLALLLLAAPLAAAWWTGAIHPRLALSGARTSYDGCGRHGVLSFEVRNPTPFAVDIRGLGAKLSTSTIDTGEPDEVPVVTLPGWRPIHLASGEHRRVVLATAAIDRDEMLHLDWARTSIVARTFLGLTRTVTNDRLYVGFGEGVSTGGCPRR